MMSQSKSKSVRFTLVGLVIIIVGITAIAVYRHQREQQALANMRALLAGESVVLKKATTPVGDGERVLRDQDILRKLSAAFATARTERPEGGWGWATIHLTFSDGSVFRTRGYCYPEGIVVFIPYDGEGRNAYNFELPEDILSTVQSWLCARAGSLTVAARSEISHTLSGTGIP